MGYEAEASVIQDHYLAGDKKARHLCRIVELIRS
jgi:hypothetical protein